MGCKLSVMLGSQMPISRPRRHCVRRPRGLAGGGRRVPSSDQGERLSAPMPPASKVSERPDVNIYGFASAALTITGFAQSCRGFVSLQPVPPSGVLQENKRHISLIGIHFQVTGVTMT